MKLLFLALLASLSARAAEDDEIVRSSILNVQLPRTVKHRQGLFWASTGGNPLLSLDLGLPRSELDITGGGLRRNSETPPGWFGELALAYRYQIFQTENFALAVSPFISKIYNTKSSPANLIELGGSLPLAYFRTPVTIALEPKLFHRSRAGWRSDVGLGLSYRFGLIEPMGSLEVLDVRDPSARIELGMRWHVLPNASIESIHFQRVSGHTNWGLTDVNVALGFEY